jgi:hypothetical protein
MGPAGNGRDRRGLAVTRVEALETGIGIRLQKACKGLEVLTRTLALTIGAVAEQRCRLVQMAPSSVIAKVDP